MWDTLSASIGLVFIIPIILFYITGNNIHLKGFLGVTGTTIISESIKYFLIGNASPRPIGAKNCNLLCNDGNQSGKPGMPSSHSASATFFLGFYFQQTENNLIRGCLIIYTALIMISRYLKQCHTISQIGTGALLGLFLSMIVVRHL